MCGNPPPPVDPPERDASSGMGRYGSLPGLVETFGCVAGGDLGGDPVVLDPAALVGTRCVAERDGVDGPDDDGESGSVTHNLYNVENFSFPLMKKCKCWCTYR